MKELIKLSILILKDSWFNLLMGCIPLGMIGYFLCQLNW
jgi:hypothetical protein